MFPKLFSQDQKDNDRLWMAWIIVLVLGMVGALLGVSFPVPPIPGTLDIGAQGISHYSGLDVTGAETTDLVVFDQTSTGDILQLEDNNSTVWKLADGGAVTHTGTMARTGTTSLTGALTVVSGGVSLTDGDVVIADDVRVTAQTVITVTNGAAFTPTGTYQGIAAAGEVTPTITIGTAGDLLVLVNTTAQTINIADSGTVKLSAAWAGTVDDILTLWCDGTDWIEVSRSAN